MDKRFNRLHRQRRRRRGRVIVLKDQELAEHFGCTIEALPGHLDGLAIGYHRDSRGAIWASLKVDDHPP